MAMPQFCDLNPCGGKIVERTLIFFKPNIILNKEVLNAFMMFFNDRRIFLRRYELQKYPKCFFKKFYAHVPEPNRSQHSEFCSLGPIGVAILEGNGVVEKARKIIGSTDSSKAKPKTLRGYFYHKYKPKVGFDNFIHASATPEDAEREIKIFFGDAR